MGIAERPARSDATGDRLSNRQPLEGGESLWRRIHRTHIVRDGQVSSAAFSDPELSVDIARIQREMSITLADEAGVAAFQASAAHSLGQETVADPLPENAAHALVIGPKSKSVQRKLRNAATFKSRERILSPG